MSVVVHAFSEGKAAARRLADALGVGLGVVRCHRFPDGEVLPTVPEPADTVLVYRSPSHPNSRIMELILATEAWRRLGAERLVLVAPYLPYMRQDAAFLPGQSISQKVFARLLASYFDRVVTVNPHLHRTPDMAALFGNTPAESLSAGPAIGDWLERAGIAERTLVIGPDEESAPLAKAVAGRLGLDWLVFTKVRHRDRLVELRLDAPGQISGRPVVIVDDICSTGSTLIAAIEQAQAAGAVDVKLAIVHALYDERTQVRLEATGVSRIVSTDSVNHPTNAIELAGLLAGALRSEVTT